MLSKSQFIRGVQCPKSLWLLKRKPELRSIPEKSEGRFEQGFSIGALATQLFPGGKLVDFDNAKLSKMADVTRELIDSGETTIYEATFIVNGIFASIDILHRDESGWHIYEVKASTRVKDVQILDAAVQYFSVNEVLPIHTVNVIYVNNKYVYHEELDLNALFNVQDITENVIERGEEVKQHKQLLENLVKSPEEPDVAIGNQCHSPYSCDFSVYCRKDVPEPSVFNLYRMGTSTKYKLYHSGISTYQQAKDSAKLNVKQLVQVESYLNNQVQIDTKKIGEFVDRVVYPISYFDFETFNEAIPRFNGQRPYMQMPFQYSLHIEQVSGEVTHKEFLGDEYSDPRELLIQSMLRDLPETGSIMAFNQSFEIARIKELANDFPEYKVPLLALIPRFVDLIVPFRNLGYYHPEFHGSFSIKSVLPAMFPNAPDLDYKSLSIQNGGMAMDTFANLSRLKNESERAEIREALLAYCKLDTWAMVKIYRALKEQLLLNN